MKQTVFLRCGEQVAEIRLVMTSFYDDILKLKLKDGREFMLTSLMVDLTKLSLPVTSTKFRLHPFLKRQGMFMRWHRDELVLKFYLRSTLGLGGHNAAFKRHPTAETQTLWALFWTNESHFILVDNFDFT